jgi:hypothetical protein
MVGWDPEGELTALLDALTDELLFGADYRTATLLSEREILSVTAIIREIAAAADMALLMPSGSTAGEPGPLRPTTVN